MHLLANTLKNKGNVLFPCTMNGIIFDIIGFLSQHLRAMGLRGIPFYAVSPIAEESLKYSNICVESGTLVNKLLVTKISHDASY